MIRLAPESAVMSHGSVNERKALISSPKPKALVQSQIEGHIRDTRLSRRRVVRSKVLSPQMILIEALRW